MIYAFKVLLVFMICGHICSANEPIRPLQRTVISENPAKTELGFLLFSEQKLSKNNSISCATCHALDRGGVDNLQRSIGIDGGVGSINAPTVFNSGLNFAQFWNGRAKTLEEQIDGPIQHPKEMGSTWVEIVKKLNADPEYKKRFALLYTDGITANNIKNAIATFEHELITPNAKFDRFLRSEVKLSELETLGYSRFKALGCVACHQGQNIGGNMFETMGVMGNYFRDRKNRPLTDDDLGRYMVTKREQDKHVFRVPSLRNVELTAPYFHDGYAKTLEEAVKIMGQYQLGQSLAKKDVDAIVAFLKTLTGETPEILKKDRK